MQGHAAAAYHLVWLGRKGWWTHHGPEKPTCSPERSDALGQQARCHPAPAHPRLRAVPLWPTDELGLPSTAL